MKVAILIPARFSSSRFPGKPLANLLGKPMIIWVAEICSRLKNVSVYVATDDERISSTVRSYGYETIMTSQNALTGTDRIAEASRSINADIFINVQGDEPMISPHDILKVIEEKKKHPDKIINCFTKLSDGEAPEDINIPKVVFDKNNNLLYISRSKIPGNKSENSSLKEFFKQVCIYAFTRAELESFISSNTKGILEKEEDIDILRFLEDGKKIRMVRTDSKSIAVDIPSDIRRVERALRDHQCLHHLA